MESYFERARSNYQSAEDEPSEEWSVVKFFYAALHAMNHLRWGASKEGSYITHLERKDWIASHCEKDVIAAYASLYAMAEDARYHPELPPMTQGHRKKARLLAESVFKNAKVSPP